MSEQKITLSNVTGSIAQLSPEKQLLLMGILQGMKMADAANTAPMYSAEECGFRLEDDMRESRLV